MSSSLLHSVPVELFDVKDRKSTTDSLLKVTSFFFCCDGRKYINYFCDPAAVGDEQILLQHARTTNR